LTYAAGGIDLNPENYAMLQGITVDGLSIQILNVVPVNLPLLLGLGDEEDPQESLSFRNLEPMDRIPKFSIV
jgi:hypothetical protein